ncbi:hypothetical protein AURDEDRAFT_112593 [Auricularia subglabra TFB-10046 SS5]|nr:hypothetical protein AURDEDRAFT_112593 [Auricularia subglabra TFB-10046 SS5]
MEGHAVRSRILPPELISRILDYVELHDLFAPLATSRDWRRVALDHPTYWRVVCLRSTSNGAIDLFLSRLAHGRQRKVYVCIEARRSCRRISDEVLPAIAEHFTRIVDFGAAVHHDQTSDLFSTLVRPAPVLERFQIFVIRPSQAPLSILPTDVFCGKAPKLTFVGLRDTGVEPTVYPAFSKVVHVDFGFTRAETFYVVPQLFSIFPRMRRFGLYSGDVDVPEDLHFPPIIPSDVESVVCFMNPDSFDFMLGVLPYHAIPSVWVAGVAEDTVDFFIGQLPGELTLDITDRHSQSPGLFDISVASTETGFKRVFGQSARRYLANVKPPICFLRDHDFAERIVALTMPNTLWGFLARHMLPFPNLRELKVQMDSQSLPVLGRTWSVSCANLQTLRLSANTVDPLYVSTDKLAAFATISLADLPSSPCPALELDAVILEGDVGVLDPHLRIPGDDRKAPSLPAASRTL